MASLYRLYGLTIASDLDLPAPPAPASGPADLVVRRRKLRLTETLGDDGLIRYRIGGRRWLLHYRDTGTFCLDGTQTLYVDLLPEASPALVQHRLLAVMLGLALRRRERLVLHANALIMNDQAVLLLGSSGAGKSTLSAALSRCGHTLLSDDLGVVDLFSGHPLVMPGPARIKLRADSRAALSGLSAMGELTDASWEEAPRAGPDLYFGKYTVGAGPGPAQEAVPLRAVYLVEPGRRIAIAALPRQEAALALLRHAHLPRSLEVTNLAAQHFVQSASLVRTTPFFRLLRGSRLSDLPALIGTLEEHLYAHAAA